MYIPAYSSVGMDWARYIVALGALMGIVTTTLVGSVDHNKGP